MAKNIVNGLDASFLQGLLSSLEETETHANGFGSLESAVVKADDNGVEVTATYLNGGWQVSIS